MPYSLRFALLQATAAATVASGVLCCFSVKQMFARQNNRSCVVSGRDAAARPGVMVRDLQA